MTPRQVLASWSGWGTTTHGDTVADDIIATLAAHGFRIVGEGQACDVVTAIDVIQRVPEIVKAEVQRRGITQKNAAAEVGVSAAAMCHVLKGRTTGGQDWIPPEGLTKKTTLLFLEWVVRSSEDPS